MFCNKCGNELREGDLFCTKCGNQVEYNVETKPAAKVKRIDETDKLSEAVELLKHGDDSCFATVYAHTYKYVYLRAKYMLGNEDDAQDLIQDVYMALYKGIDKLESNNSLYGWLKTIIFRQGIKFIEKKRKSILLSDEGEEMFEQLPDENVKIEEGYGNEEDIAFIKGCIELLSEEQRLVVLAYYYDNMKVSEIADIMGISEGTVKSRLYLARKRLQGMLEEQEEKQGYKFYGAGMPMLVFALGDIMESDIAVDISVLQNGYAELCGELGIDIAKAAEHVVETVGQDVDKFTELADGQRSGTAKEFIEDSNVMAEKAGSTAIETAVGIAKKKIAIAVAGVLVAGGIGGAIIAGTDSDKEVVHEMKTTKEETPIPARNHQPEEADDYDKFLVEYQNDSDMLYYTLMDLAGDGEKELIIASLENPQEPSKYEIVQIFGKEFGAEKELTAVEHYWENSLVDPSNYSENEITQYYICENGMIKEVIESNDGLDIRITYFKLSEHSVETEAIDSAGKFMSGTDDEYYGVGNGFGVKEDYESVKMKYALKTDIEWFKVFEYIPVPNTIVEESRKAFKESGQNDSVIDWYDSNLEKAMQEITGINGKIKTSDVYAITELDLSGRGISNINALQNLENLQVLILSDNSIINVDSLQYITSLKYLDVSYNPLESYTIDALNKLPNLNYLNLDYTGVDNYEVFMGYGDNLKKLSLKEERENVYVYEITDFVPDNTKVFL